jgi:diadenylate cyclase
VPLRSGEDFDVEARPEPGLMKALEMIAPGTALREGIESILDSHTGGLIVIGEPEDLSFLNSGGIKLDIDYTPAFL